MMIPPMILMLLLCVLRRVPILALLELPVLQRTLNILNHQIHFPFQVLFLDLLTSPHRTGLCLDLIVLLFRRHSILSGFLTWLLVPFQLCIHHCSLKLLFLPIQQRVISHLAFVSGGYAANGMLMYSSLIASVVIRRGIVWSFIIMTLCTCVL